MKVGDLLFVRPTTLIGHGVSKVLKSEYSHLAMAISDTQIIESQIFKDTQIVDNYYTDYKLIKLNLTSEQRSRLSDIINSLPIKSIKYDLTHALSWLLQVFIFNYFKVNVIKYFDNDEEYICIELVLNLLNSIGIDLKVKDEQLITFDDLIQLLSERGYIDEN